jgi:hypothetical protein
VTNFHFALETVPADDGAVRAVLAFVEPAQAAKVTEEFAITVDKMDDHFGSIFLRAISWLGLALA